MKKIYYTWSQVEGACLEIARQMSVHNWRPDYIVGIGRGGLVPANLLSQYTGIKMNSLDISLRDGGDTVSNCGMAEDAYEGKNILIVDDINDQGSTIAWIKQDWRESALPSAIRWDNDIWHKTVRFATLTNNLSSKEDVDYSVWEVNKADEDCWLVYPWEDYWL
jgi:hypoxanthine phosphoribosyltransferase